MARGKKQAPAQPAVAPAQAQPVAEYILSFQDKKFTQTHTQHLMKIYESVSAPKQSPSADKWSTKPPFSCSLIKPSLWSSSWPCSRSQSARI